MKVSGLWKGSVLFTAVEIKLSTELTLVLN